MTIRQFIIIVSIGLCLACQTTGDRNVKAPPTIEKSMDIDDALDAALEHGGETLNSVKKLFTKRKDWQVVAPKIKKRILEQSGNYESPELINALNIYQSSVSKADPEIFRLLVASEKPISKILAWNLAANLPSKEMANAIDQELTLKVQQGREEELLLPQMALAAQSNHLAGAYTLVRQGLMTKGDDAFAKSMIVLDRSRATVDFLDYLAKASVEELRQINQKSINVYSSIVILRHLTTNSVPINHDNFPQLFLYAISRNQSLAELASLVINENLGPNYQLLAHQLSRMPDWVQVAYIEAARRRVSPNLGAFLAELRDATPYDHVVEEIDEIR